MIHASWSANRNLDSDQPFLIRIVEDEFTLEAPHAGDVVLVTKADGTVSEDVLGRLVFETRSKSSGTRGKLLWYFEQSPTPEAADIRRRSLRDVQPRSASSPSREPGDGSKFSTAAEPPAENAAQQKSQNDAYRLRAPVFTRLETEAERAKTRAKRDEHRDDDTGEVPF